MSPEPLTDRLATTRIFREQITVRSAPMTARLANGDRLRAFQQLVRRAPRKPSWLYDAQRAEERRSLPDQRQHEAICDGIAASYIDERDLATFFASQYLMYRGLIRSTSLAAPTYCDATREMAEALEALAVARANPTPEAVREAQQQGTEAAIAVTAHVMHLTRSA